MANFGVVQRLGISSVRRGSVPDLCEAQQRHGFLLNLNSGLGFRV